MTPIADLLASDPNVDPVFADAVRRVTGPTNKALARIEREVTDDFVVAVEDEVGMGHRAWDTIDPKQVVAAVLTIDARRRALIQHTGVERS